MLNPIGGGKEIEDDSPSFPPIQRKLSRAPKTNAKASPSRTTQKIELPRKKGQNKSDPNRNASPNHNDSSKENKIFPKKTYTQYIALRLIQSLKNILHQDKDFKIKTTPTANPMKKTMKEERLNPDK